MMAQKTFSKPYFHFNPNDQKSADFAALLSRDLGDFGIEDADVIINVGGDGTVIRSFHLLPQLPNFAVKSPSSNSKLFNGHAGIDNATDLKRAFESAQPHVIRPLKGEVGMSDGTTIDIHAYQDIVARSFTSEAVISDNYIDGIPLHRVMGTGCMVSTPMGASALNETNGGKVIGMESGQLVFTLSGVSDTHERERLSSNDKISVIFDNESRFYSELSTQADRRETAIVFDSYSLLPDGQPYTPGERAIIDTSLRSVQTLGVEMDFDPARERILMLNPQFRTP